MNINNYLDSLINCNSFTEMESVCTDGYNGNENTDLLIARLNIPLDYRAPGYIYKLEVLQERLRHLGKNNQPSPLLMQSCDATIVALRALQTKFEGTRGNFAPLFSGILLSNIISYIDPESKTNFSSTSKTSREAVLATKKLEDKFRGQIPLIELGRGGTRQTFEHAVAYAVQEKMTCLNLIGYDEITDEDIEFLFSSIPVIREIQLSWIGINDAFLEKLATRHGTTLRSFILSDTHEWDGITDVGVHSLVEKCQHLKTIVLPLCSELTTTALSSIARNCPELEYLNLEESLFDQTVPQAYLELGQNCTQLTKVNLKGNTHTLDNITELITAGRSITELELAGLSEEDLLAIVYAGENLKMVYFEESFVTVRVLRAIADKMPKIRKIIFDYPAEDADVEYVVQKCSQLKEIEVKGSTITDGGIQAIALHCRGLMDANFENCVQLTNASIAHLVAAGRWLRNLALPAGITDESLFTIARGFKGLKAISIPCHRVTTNGIIAVVQECQDLSIINLKGQATDSILEAIAAHCNDLTSLAIFDSPLVTKDALQNLIDQSEKLEKLFLLESWDAEALEEIKEENPTLKIYSSSVDQDADDSEDDES